MSVYTPLSLEQVQQFAQAYPLEIIDLQPIQGGIENTNYFLTAQDGQQYVLTVFEELDEVTASELFPVLQHLETQQIPVAVPLTHSQKPIHFIVGKPAQIAPRMPGQHPIPSTRQQVIQMGSALAKLHLALQDFPFKRQQQPEVSWWESTKDTLYPILTKHDQQLLDDVFSRFATSQAQYPDLPTGLTHADLFRDNTLYVGNQLSAILDFSELSHDQWLMDISITLNDFCTDFPQSALNLDKAQHFMDAYHQIRPLSAAETDSLNVYLAMAACRFWLLRLDVAQRNKTEQRASNDILEKDPNEMRDILVDRLTQEYSW